MMHVLMYTDGAARGNPEGPGGYGVVLQYTDSSGVTHESERSQGFVKTTNNRMELLAAIVGLESLRRPCDVELYSDSQYLVQAFNDHWIENWKKNGWKTSSGTAVDNQDLWFVLSTLTKKHHVTSIKVNGHADHPENNRCDELAREAIDEYRKLYQGASEG